MDRIRSRTIVLFVLVIISGCMVQFWVLASDAGTAAQRLAVRPLADRLAADHRAASLLVLGRQANGEVQCLFGEWTADGSQLVGIRQFTLPAGDAVVHTQWMKADSGYLILFRSIESVTLEAAGIVPDYYASGLAQDSAADVAFWQSAWADHPAGQVVDSQVKIQLEPGTVFDLIVQPGGQLVENSRPVDAPTAAMLHKAIKFW